MDTRIPEKNYIIALKYIYIAVFVSFILLGRGGSTLYLVLLLVSMIINQVRFFLLKRRNLVYYLTYLVEFALSCVLYDSAIGFKYVVFMPAMIDVATNLSNIWAYAYFTGTIGANIVLGSNLKDIVTSLICSIPVLILGIIVRDESGQKVKAQQLYDRLREREEELKRLNKELENNVNTIEEITLLRERNRISRELHDNVGHALSTIMIQLGAIENVAPRDGKVASEMAGALGKFTDESLQSIRAAVRSMKPREFEEYEGIIAISEMIKNFEKLSGIAVRFRLSEKFWKLTADQTIVIYRLIQEFLSNSIRHGRATEVKIFLNFLPNSLRVYIKDNGAGCSNIVEGVGLKSIRERVKVWGGSLEYYSQEGKGFEIVATIEKVRLGVGGM